MHYKFLEALDNYDQHSTCSNTIYKNKRYVCAISLIDVHIRVIRLYTLCEIHCQIDCHVESIQRIMKYAYARRNNIKKGVTLKDGPPSLHKPASFPPPFLSLFGLGNSLSQYVNKFITIMLCKVLFVSPVNVQKTQEQQDLA